MHGLGSSFEHGWRSAGWIDLLADAGRRVDPVDVLGHGTAAAPHDPAAYTHLSILSGTGNGANNIQATVNHLDGSSEQIIFSSLDEIPLVSRKDVYSGTT